MLPSITCVFLLGLFVKIFRKQYVNSFKYSTILITVVFAYHCIFSTNHLLSWLIDFNFSLIVNYTFIILFNSICSNAFILFIVILYNLNKLDWVKSPNLIYFVILIIFIKLTFEDIYVQEKAIFYINNLPKVNMQLINNLVIIHPMFTHLNYSFLLCFILIFFYKTDLVNLIKLNKILKTKILFNFSGNKKYLFFKSQLLIILLINTIVLLLGGFWALQELIWNNWWSWDLIELVALIFFTVWLSVYHLYSKKYYINVLNYFYLKIFFSFTWFYFFIRLDVSNSLHSFNSFSSIELYFYTFILIYFILIFLSKKVEFKLNLFREKKIKIFIFFFELVLFLLCLYCVFIWINSDEQYIYQIELIQSYKFLFFLFFLITYLVYFLNLNEKNITASTITIYFLFFKILQVLSLKQLRFDHSKLLIFVFLIYIENLIKPNTLLVDCKETLFNVINFSKDSKLTMVLTYNGFKSPVFFFKECGNEYSFLISNKNGIVNFLESCWSEELINFYPIISNISNNSANFFLYEDSFNFNILNTTLYTITILFIIYIIFKLVF